MEENRRFSWADLFIKVILVVIFILFTVWLLSLSNKGISNSLNVLTDDIFAQNIAKMKEVGKEYFTTERLPEKVGDVKTITLEKMYDKKLLLELKNKYGNTCSAKNSYVSIEKYETEYQMKVYLECGKQSDYIIVIMGCYDYCDTDICEKKETVDVKEIEYEYKKTTGGKWTDYGKWSEWSKVSVTKTDYRQVETKVVNEEYTYDKTVTETLFEEMIVSCPEGYELTSDGTKCYKEVFTTTTKNPVCKTFSGYVLISQNGFTCNYNKTTTSVVDPVCPNKDGWNLSRNGFTCNYTRTVSKPYTVSVTVPKTCYSSKPVIPCTGCAPVTQRIPYDCSYTTTETRYKDVVENDSNTATCPSGSDKVESSCVKTVTNNTTIDAVCENGYTPSGNKCSKTVKTNDYKDVVKTCPVGYNKTSDNTKCYKDVDKIVKVTGTKEVTYYRYRVREYIGGTTDYKWSKSKNDKTLLDAGYKLTGKTR